MGADEEANQDFSKKGTFFIPFDESKEDDQEKPDLEGPLARSQFDLADGPLLRFQAYRSAWDKCLNRVKEIVHALHKPVVDAIIHTVQDAYKDFPDDVVLPETELITLAISGSDRMQLHEVITRTTSILCEPESESESEDIPGAFISRLLEADCQSIITLMKALISGFISQPIARNKQPQKIKPSSSLVAYDMHLLRAWYEAVRSHYGSKSPILIVQIQDLHTIDSAILGNVLEICSLHVPHLPLVFLIGTADPNHLNATLGRSTLTCLRIEKHILPWDKKSFENLIKETFFGPNFVPDVMLGPSGFDLLFEEFTRHNATLDAVLSILQLLHMQHFYNPLSFIVNPLYDNVLTDVLGNPPEEWRPFFELLRRHCISADLRLLEGAGAPRWSEILPQQVIDAVLQARSQFRIRTSQMKIALNVLDTVLKFVRSHGQKAPDVDFEKIASKALRGALSDQEAREACDIVKQLKASEMLVLLEELHHLLYNLPSGVRHLTSELRKKVVVIKNEEPFTEDMVREFADSLATYFEESLKPFEDIDFLDVWWTGDTEIPHSPLNPNPHLSIVTALLEPHKYLGWQEPSNKSRRELSSLPDTCILFRRYVESGRMINIYDWYESFVVALEEGKNQDEEDEGNMSVDETPSKRKGKEKEKMTAKRKRTDGDEQWKREVQARFLRSMHELEFVGFLKHTGRKADHVVKTAFDVLD